MKILLSLQQLNDEKIMMKKHDDDDEQLGKNISLININNTASLDHEWHRFFHNENWKLRFCFEIRRTIDIHHHYPIALLMIIIWFFFKTKIIFIYDIYGIFFIHYKSFNHFWFNDWILLRYFSQLIGYIQVNFVWKKCHLFKLLRFLIIFLRKETKIEK